LATLFFGRSSSSEDSRFLFEAPLRCELNIDFSPLLVTGDLFRVEVRRGVGADVDVFLLFAAAAAASAFLS